SSIKNLVPIPHECEVTSDNEIKSNEPDKDVSSVFTTYLNPLFNDSNDVTSNDDVPIRESKVHSNPLFDDDGINSDELESHKFSGPLISIHIAEEERIRREHADYIICMEMLFTINPCPRPTVNADTIIESLLSLPIPVQDGDSQREDIVIITETDDVLPPSVENDDDSDGEIDAVNDLHVDNSISNSKHEYFDDEASDFNNPSVPLPPPEPPDAKYDFVLDAGDEISVVMNVSDELECIDAKVEFDDSNDDYSTFMFVIYFEVFSFLLFDESEDAIFDPGISVESQWICPSVIEVSCVRIFVPAKSSIEEPEHSFSVGYEHFNTTLVTELDEVAESSIKNLIPIPRECKVTSNNGSESIEPVKDDSLVFTTFLNPLFNNKDDVAIHKDDVTIEESKVFSNPLFDNDDMNSDELESHVESNVVESLSTHDALIDSHMEMLFTINPCPRPTVNTNTNVESIPSSLIPVQDNDSQREEIDIVTNTDVLPPGFENDDSEEEIDVVEELRVDNSISNSANEYFDRDEISVVMNVSNELECIDAEVEFENDDYSSFIFVIYFKLFSFLLFAESEDTIFDPDEVAESSIKNLVPIPRECKVTSNNGSESIEPVKDDSLVFTTFPNPLFNNKDDVAIHEDDVTIEESKVFSNPLFDNDDMNSDELESHVESNSYEMLFTINPRPHPTVNTNTNVESIPSSLIPAQDNDSQREEIDIVTNTDVLPPGFENDDSEEEIDVVEELRVDNSISNSANEYFDSDFEP
nr:hypothetical protein [Tanacetum cinerariifolium]